MKFHRGQGWSTLQNETHPEPMRMKPATETVKSSNSTTFSELISPKRFTLRDKFSNISKDIDPRSFLASCTRLTSKKEYLNSLLHTENEVDRSTVNQITHVVKLLYKHFPSVDQQGLNRFWAHFIRDQCLLTQNKTHTEWRKFRD